MLHGKPRSVSLLFTINEQPRKLNSPSDAKCSILHLAHHQRELLGIAQTSGQDWPTQLSDLLSEIHLAVQTAKTTALSARQLNTFRKRYDSYKENAPPVPEDGGE